MTDFEHVLPDEIPAAGVGIDWRLLGGGEIYDRFIQKGAKLGYQANKVILQLLDWKSSELQCMILLILWKRMRIKPPWMSMRFQKTYGITKSLRSAFLKPWTEMSHRSSHVKDTMPMECKHS